ncbi:inosine triphosphate pyrophosphatase [Nematocida sp. AWRm77]|nr:inosine triphosphate pyrophosphatase [Nematocida sp. AWRm77]
MLTFVTGSARKRKEIAKYLGESIEYRFISEDLPEIQGTAREILEKKLKDAYAIVKGPVVVEDYSLYIDRLCGFPGPYIKSLLSNGALGKIVQNLAPLGELECTAEGLYGYLDHNKQMWIFSTSTRGRLVPPKKTTDGLYGVDDCFVQEGSSQPFFYLSEAEQDKLSIRKTNIEKLLQHITTGAPTGALIGASTSASVGCSDKTQNQSQTQNKNQSLSLGQN